MVVLLILASTDEDEHRKKLEMLLEAARRANWDALHGPRHLRSGRYHPTPDELVGDREDVARAAQHAVEG
jgi:hypothetical protein